MSLNPGDLVSISFSSAWRAHSLGTLDISYRTTQESLEQLRMLGAAAAADGAKRWRIDGCLVISNTWSAAASTLELRILHGQQVLHLIRCDDMRADCLVMRVDA